MTENCYLTTIILVEQKFVNQVVPLAGSLLIRTDHQHPAGDGGAAADASSAAPSSSPAAAALLEVDVFSSTGAVHDYALQGAQQARHHQRRRRQARSALADTRQTTSHQVCEQAIMQIKRLRARVWEVSIISKARDAPKLLRINLKSCSFLS